MKKIYILSLFYILIILNYIKIELAMHYILDVSFIFKITIVIIISFLLYIFKEKLLILFFPIVLLVLLSGNNVILIVVYNLFIVFISYKITKLYTKEIVLFLLLVLLLNLIFIFIEVYGLIPSLSYYQTYTADIYGYRTNLMEIDLPIATYQCRPHGIYSSTIILSYVLVNVNAILLFYIRNLVVITCISIASIFSGGTALLLAVPILLILLYLMKRYTFSYFFKSILIYFSFIFIYWMFYTSLFQVNYNFNAILMSFNTRFDMSNTHSTLTSFFYPSIFLLIVFVLWLIYKFKSIKFNEICIYIYISTPICISLLIHPLISSTRLYILIGIILSLSTYTKKDNLKI